jgi:hypothetical protein
MNSDFKDALRCLLDEGVRFLVVGGYAVIHYTQPRFTKDLDVWLEPSDANARAVARAFRTFGLPLIEITEGDLAQPGTQFMAGIPPNAIDFITTCSALEFAGCWERRELVVIDDLEVPYLSRTDLVEAKRQLGRDQDRVDLRLLESEGS